MNLSDAKTRIGQWSSGDVDVDGIRIHFTSTGGNKPPFLLVHGFSDDGLCWTSVALALEADFDVIMVDARGHGDSDAPVEGYSAVDMAKDLAGVISTLQIRKPLIMGHSMGAATALTFAALYPEIPVAILLEDPPARWNAAPPENPSNDGWTERMQTWIRDLQSQSKEELVQKQKVDAPTWSDLEVEMWADAHLKMSLNVVSGKGPRSHQDVEQLKRIQCPTLLITADVERGALVKATDAEALRDYVPQLQTVHIAGAGHSIHREQFDAFLKEVKEFAASVPSEG